MDNFEEREFKGRLGTILYCLAVSVKKDSMLIEKLRQNPDKLSLYFTASREADSNEKIKCLHNFFINGIDLRFDEYKFYLELIKELSMIEIVVFMVFRRNQINYGFNIQKPPGGISMRDGFADVSERIPNIDKIIQDIKIRQCGMTPYMVVYALNKLSEKCLVRNPSQQNFIKATDPFFGLPLYKLIEGEIDVLS